jgi:XTP/dITP diphosphohydrolase
MIHLLLATTNKGKLREIRGVLAGLDIDITTLQDFPGIPEAVEDAATFAENARAKALHYAAATGRLTVAEDSGLEIDALGGAPGVQSARFAAEQAPTYPQKFALIYRLLRERTGDAASPARFVCALALAEPGGTAHLRQGSGGLSVAPARLSERRREAPGCGSGRVVFEAEGRVEGRIVAPPRGSGGFGYDPIFYYPPFGATLAEVDEARKASASHRGQAFGRLREYLRTYGTTEG